MGFASDLLSAPPLPGPLPAAPNRLLTVRRLGLIEYVPAWDLQEALLAETLALKTRNRLAETAGTTPEFTPNHLLLCEHPSHLHAGQKRQTRTSAA